MEKDVLLSRLIAFSKSCVKLAMPHFAGGKVLMKRMVDVAITIVNALNVNNK